MAFGRSAQQLDAAKHRLSAPPARQNDAEAAAILEDHPLHWPQGHLVPAGQEVATGPWRKLFWHQTETAKRTVARAPGLSTGYATAKRAAAMDVTRIRLTHRRYTDKDSPFFMDTTNLRMRRKWEIMQAVTSGTEYLHENAEIYLPREPREEKRRTEDGIEHDPWQARVNLSVLAPFTKRLISNAAGMVLRRKIQLKGGDPWWEEEFRKDVDGDGSSLDQFAKKRLEVALTYGMSSLIVDAGKRSSATTAADELNPLRPYFVPIDPWQYLGSRRESDEPGAKLKMFRYQEERKADAGKYGEEYVPIARVIMPGAYEIYEADEGNPVDSGTFDLDYIPLVNVYAEKEGFLCSSPPLADVAHLNIAHYRRLADLLHSLHVAAIGLLILEDYDGEEGVTGLNYAINMTMGAKAYWVKCDAGSFVAQGELLDRLENEISHLGVTKLLGQKFVAESADAKRIDQQQANCVLAVAAQELEAGLNEAFRMAAEYYKKEPPQVVISKDFDFYRLLGQDVSVLSDLEMKGQITTELFHSILFHGEWIPEDVDLVELLKNVKKLKEEARRAMLEQQQSQNAPGSGRSLPSAAAD